MTNMVSHEPGGEREQTRLTDPRLVPDTKRRQILARAIQFAMEVRSEILGAAFSVTYDSKGHLDYRIGVTEEGIGDSELLAFGEFLEMADAASIPVTSEVEGDFMHLLTIYHDFGFRLAESDEYEDELAAAHTAQKAVEKHVTGGGHPTDLSFTMHRKAWSGALVAPEELRHIKADGRKASTPFHERAQQRDAILVALQKRGMSAAQAGCRISPNMTDMEVCMRNSERRRQGWDVPRFDRPRNGSTQKTQAPT